MLLSEQREIVPEKISRSVKEVDQESVDIVDNGYVVGIAQHKNNQPEKENQNEDLDNAKDPVGETFQTEGHGLIIYQERVI